MTVQERLDGDSVSVTVSVTHYCYFSEHYINTNLMQMTSALGKGALGGSVS